MILMIDNYDSFTYNVYQYIGSLYPQIQVVRNDEITIDEIRNLQNLENNMNRKLKSLVLRFLTYYKQMNI